MIINTNQRATVCLQLECKDFYLMACSFATEHVQKGHVPQHIVHISQTLPIPLQSNWGLFLLQFPAWLVHAFPQPMHPEHLQFSECMDTSVSAKCQSAWQLVPAAKVLFCHNEHTDEEQLIAPVRT